MDKKTFLNQLAEQLLLDDTELDENTILSNLDEYDSMAVMLIIAFVDENFSTKLSAVQLQSITTVESLMKLIGMERFK